MRDARLTGVVRGAIEEMGSKTFTVRGLHGTISKETGRNPMYAVIQELCTEGYIVLVEKGKGSVPNVYRKTPLEVDKNSHEDHSSAASPMVVDEVKDFDEIVSVRNGVFSNESFGNAVILKILQMDADILSLSSDNKNLQKETQFLKNETENYKRTLSSTKNKLLRIAKIPPTTEISISVLIDKINYILNDKKTLLSKSEQHAKENAKLTQKLEKSIKSCENYKILNSRKDAEIAELKQEIQKLVEKINTKSGGTVVLKDFANLGKVLNAS